MHEGNFECFQTSQETAPFLFVHACMSGYRPNESAVSPDQA